MRVEVTTVLGVGVVETAGPPPQKQPEPLLLAVLFDSPGPLPVTVVAAMIYIWAMTTFVVTTGASFQQISSRKYITTFIINVIINTLL